MDELARRVKPYETRENLEKALGKPVRVLPGSEMQILGDVCVYEAADGEVWYGVVLNRVVGARLVPTQKK
jgi:hypothetical protein